MVQIKWMLYLLLYMFGLNGFSITDEHATLTNDDAIEGYITNELTPMEALDQVKSLYAANFEKVECAETKEYYYKLPMADYYLRYEGLSADHESYLFHLYEFVLDEPEEGIGHTYTYGWYTVNQYSGEIITYE